MHNESTPEITIDELVDSFTARLEDGEHPSLAEYKEKYPQLAQQIDAVFPALVMLGGVVSQPPTPGLAIDESIPQVLGEYEIIQEVGRGGMGIVFEAQHTTMRRRVALKVLPKSAAQKSNYLSRFLTEARSAGALHHNNIVPVFDVGESQGLHFYAMQFIHGDNLDRVIEDIRRLRVQSTANERAADVETCQFNPLSISQNIAMDLMNEPVKTIAGPADASIEQDNPEDCLNECHENTLENSGIKSAALSDPVFSAQNSTTTIRSRSVFHQRVAEVGIQVSHALDYAHSRNILHRDIKPANLILDTSGTVWVTDFGLAKIQSDDLTKTGDIVGTLRYMAPERFSGEADRRSDIYSLGLTLYELCTLRHAFDNIDPVNLLRDVASRDALPPRKIDESIPADLETIILKAIESQPERRYQTANDLAEDLQFFLDDRPIRARRASMAERFWRVCRRNPGLATMSACIAGLLIAMVISSVQFGFYKSRQAKEEITLRKESQNSLYLSKLDQAKVRRYSKRIGQRFKTLDSIRQAVALLPALELSSAEQQTARVALRNEAIAALTLIDLQPIWAKPIVEGWGRGQSIAFDGDYSIAALGHPDGRIRILQTDIQGSGNDVSKDVVVLPTPGQPVWVIKISPDGRYVAASNHKENAVYQKVQLNVWDLERPEAPIFSKMGVIACDFSDDSQSLAFSFGSTVQILSLADQEVTTIKPDFPPRVVKFSSDGTQVAISERNGRKISIWDTNASQELPDAKPELRSTVEANDRITAMDWQSERAILVAGTVKGKIACWQNNLDTKPTIILSAHQHVIKRMHIHPDRPLVVSGSLDSTVRLSDLISGEEALLIDDPVYLLDTGFSIDGSLCFTSFRQSAFGVWKFAKPLLQVLAGSESEATGSDTRFHHNHPHIVARSSNLGVEIWDTFAKRKLTTLPDETYTNLCFSNDGQTLFTSGLNGLKRWPLKITRANGSDLKVEVGEYFELLLHSAGTVLPGTLGDTLVTNQDFSPKIIDANDGSELRKFKRHGGLASMQISADGRWLLTGTNLGWGVGVWDLETGEQTRMLMEDQTSVAVTTHPVDPRWFITNTGTLQFWNTTDWKPTRVSDSAVFHGAVGRFSSDGSLLAIKSKTDGLVVLDYETGQEVFSLESFEGRRLLAYDFSPDDASLALSCYDNLQILDFNRLRKELDQLGLNWD